MMTVVLLAVQDTIQDRVHEHSNSAVQYHNLNS